MLGDCEVRYFRCKGCGFVQTEHPHWLDRAYAKVITRQDLGLLARNIEFAGRTEGVVRLCLDPAGRFLDFGGGYGLLVRCMRERGIDFRLYEPMCENLCAGPAVVHALEGSRWEMVTSFEVLEHLVDPVAVVRQLMSVTDTLLFSTTLIPEPAPSPSSWEYYGFEHGQHVSLLTRRSIERLAERVGSRSITNGVNLHLLTRSSVPEWRFRLALGRWGRFVVRRLRKRASLTAADVEALRGRLP